MNAVRGRVRGGHIETDAALPEGAFDLDEAQLTELETRVAAADR